ncbi:sulfotransferase, putative [Stanieria cyanosphaera PCC 7437]|uniref:Sulfotransferase, putative n=1 Tax=Stanieria cyanosphaera (strain ATCC 29371 / PCC 7437) TaxID=111780 RepID=K9XVP8_STAC7|nr:Stf0 family sulfotransferase [Stanieria cyanosphaera]AFZ36144.1 sulfotransferase, putative [Stanieria cyanosphaera PCC 7437]
MKHTTELTQKFARKFHEYQHQLINKMIDSHFLPSDNNYQKFIIVCNIRTGSTMLCSLLSSHSQILCFFELFHRHLNSVPFSTLGYQNKSKNKTIIDLRNNNPQEFLEQEIYKNHQKKIKAVGFKLLYTQGRTDNPWWNSSEYDRWWKDVGKEPCWNSNQSNLWQYLKENKDIAIIHLKRNNLLEAKVSGITAQTTGNWGIGATGGINKNNVLVKCELNFEECMQDFEALRRMEDEADEFFAEHRKLVITYEELVENTANITNKIQVFLGLKTENLVTQSKKQATCSLLDVIDNYYQLKSQFTNTRWSNFF